MKRQTLHSALLLSGALLLGVLALAGLWFAVRAKTDSQASPRDSVVSTEVVWNRFLPSTEAERALEKVLRGGVSSVLPASRREDQFIAALYTTLEVTPREGTRPTHSCRTAAHSRRSRLVTLCIDKIQVLFQGYTLNEWDARYLRRLVPRSFTRRLPPVHGAQLLTSPFLLGQ